MPRPNTQRAAPNPYHHLGATSADAWAGVLGRIGVSDPQVRGKTLDFTAARFMARRSAGSGATTWLEAGWAETGWAGDGRQRIYSYDTNRNAWTFFDDYAIAPGDQVWIYLESTSDGAADATAATWLAWLWWGDKWHLLSRQDLPLTKTAQVEQYVEVYADPKRSGGYGVPPIAFDNVQVKAAPGEQPRFWREDVAPATTGDSGAYCVNWTTRFDTWSAGDCP
ncbi:MAG: hypothetical protein HOV79_27695 [Hamadaea sp.]|nr:hypothetical protein [Hamadaea sp.]